MSALKSKLSRRAALVLLAGVGAAGVFGARWFNVSAEVTGGALSVRDAHAKAVSGEVMLIDIRRPDEWARTGVAEGAAPLDMRRGDFVDELLVLTGGDRSLPVALICARGVRSRAMSRRLEAAGFTNIIDVPEGMFGSGAGPGWLKTGLPVVR